MDRLNEQSGSESHFSDQLKSCKLHESEYKLISLDECETPNLIFKCLKCPTEPNEQIINVSEFLCSTDKHVFNYLPGISKNLSENVLEALNSKQIDKIEEVEEFFKDIKQLINSTLEDIQQEMVKKAIQVNQFQENLGKEYHKLTRKAQIKQLIEDESQSIEEKSENLKQEIKSILSRSNENQFILEQLLAEQTIDIISIEQKELFKSAQNGLSQVFATFGDELSVASTIQTLKFKQTKDIKIMKFNKKMITFEVEPNSLNLQVNQSLDNVQQKHLFTEIGRIHSIQNLVINMKLNTIQPEGNFYLAESLRQLNNLTSLNLNFRRARIEQIGLKHLSRSIAQLKNLTQLTLDLSSNNNIGPDETQTLSLSIAQIKNLASLSLNLFCNKIGPKGQQSILSSLSQLKNLTSLNLDLNSNKIGSGALRPLAFLVQLQNLTSLTIDMSSNSINSQGAQYLSSWIKQLKNLTSLVLHISSNPIGHEGASHLTSSLAQLNNLTSLTMNLNDNQIGPENEKNIWYSLSELKNLTLLTLDLYSNEINSQSISHLTSSLTQLANLTSLTMDLSSNQFGPEGAEHLSSLLIQQKGITQLALYLRNTEIGIEGAKYLQNSLTQFEKLTKLTLDLRQSEITQECVNNLSSSIEKLKIENKNVYFDNIDD